MGAARFTRLVACHELASEPPRPHFHTVHLSVASARRFGVGFRAFARDEHYIFLLCPFLGKKVARESFSSIICLLSFIPRIDRPCAFCLLFLMFKWLSIVFVFGVKVLLLFFCFVLHSWYLIIAAFLKPLLLLCRDFMGN